MVRRGGATEAAIQGRGSSSQNIAMPRWGDGVASIDSGVLGPADEDDWEQFRGTLRKALDRPETRAAIFVLVVANFGFLVIQTDHEAVKGTVNDPMYEEPTTLMVVVGWCFNCFFLAETIARLVDTGWNYIWDGWIIDFVVVLGDVVLAIISSVTDGEQSHTFSILRVIRLLRLTRVLKIIQQFPELTYLLNGMVCSFKAVFWGMIMVCLIVLLWAIIAVQFLHDINFQVVGERLKKGEDGCDRCVRAFSSVFNSIVTFVQTLVAGDSWGATAIPIIEAQPWTFPIFLIAFASVTLAALNLILAAIVDSGQQAREDAREARLADTRRKEKEAEEERFKYLLSLCQEIDDDDSGRLSKEELLLGFDNNRNFKQAMQEMDYEKADLEVLFPTLDKDKDGTVDYSEFLDVMQKTKEEDARQMMVFMKYAIMDMWHNMEARHRNFESKVLRILENLETTVPTLPKPMSLDSRGSSERSVANASGHHTPRNGGRGQAKDSQTPKQVEDASSVDRDSIPEKSELRAVASRPKARTRTPPKGNEAPQPKLLGTETDSGKAEAPVQSPTLRGLSRPEKKAPELHTFSEELIQLTKKLVQQSETQIGTLTNVDAMLSALVNNNYGCAQGPGASLRPTKPVWSPHFSPEAASPSVPEIPA